VRRRSTGDGGASRVARAAAAALLPLVALLASGCGALFSDEPAEPTRGSLGDAAEEAAKPPAQQKPVEPPAEANGRGSQQEMEPAETGGDEVVVVPAQLDSSGAPLATPPAVVADSSAILPADDDGRFHAGPVAGLGFEAGGVFERIDVFGVALGISFEDESMGNLQVLYSRPRLDPARGLDASISKIEEVALDLSVRGYLTASHTFAGVYVGGGYRIGLMLWDWRNPIQVPNDAGGFDEIGNDSIVTHSFHVDLGVSPVQLAHFHVGCHGVYGLKLYANSTLQNFQNDLFQNVGFGQILFDVAYVR
jgi:hypothetical protein